MEKQGSSKETLAKTNSRFRQRNQKKQQKEERIVHKGIYISNERRKGPGGWIKCDTFEGKVEVMDKNPAIHESEVQWIEIRRYVKGDKKDDKRKNRGQNNDQKKGFKGKAGKKYVQAKNNIKNQNQLKGDKKEDSNEVKPTNKDDKQVPIQPNEQSSSSPQKSLSQASSPTFVPTDIQFQISVKEQVRVSHKLTEQEKKQNENVQAQRNQDQIETESEHDEDDREQKQGGVEVVDKTETTIVMKKTLEEVSKPEEGEGKKKEKAEEEKEKRQEVIVARIIKQSKIVYKQKKFVAILTCQKKKSTRDAFIQKDIKPIKKICQDYFLDVSPIHSRLPKMQMDTLVSENLTVLEQYIEKTYPQKGKQLTNKKLNEILDVIESIYVVASFGLWENDRPYANIHQVIGKTMTIDGECNCFLFEHQLNDFSYDDTRIENQKDKNVELKPTEQHKNINRMIFTIDPSTSVDLDDALSIEKINENLFQIGIHIADVSQYLKYIEREELIKRTTSVYLPHKVFHMLTPQLMKISSLNPNVTRLAFSIYVKMNLQGQIVQQSRLQKTIMKSRFKLSYETVQEIITAKINFDQFLKKYPYTTVDEFDTLVQKLQDLTKIGLAHREKRIKFEVFENREIHFELDQERWPIDISVESRFTSKKIVEEYMIIGNVEAASHLIKNFKQKALIIYHPRPSQLAIKNFNETFKFLGKTFVFDDIHQVQNQFLEIEKDKTISEQIKQYMYFKGRRMQESAGYKLYNDAVKEIIERDGGNGENVKLKNVHFALGEDFYTHFTSPMRRMADILVHETLNSIIYKTEPKAISPQQIQKINEGRKHTKRLKKDLTQIYICLMIHKTGKRIQQDGIITSFGLKSVSIYIPYFDMMKEIIWRDELDLHRVSKNRQNQEMLDVCIYYDREFPSRDIMWKVKKYDKVKLIIDCTKRPPLRLSISLEVTSTKGRKQLIKAYNPEI